MVGRKRGEERGVEGRRGRKRRKGREREGERREGRKGRREGGEEERKADVTADMRREVTLEWSLSAGGPTHTIQVVKTLKTRKQT